MTGYEAGCGKVGAKWGLILFVQCTHAPIDGSDGEMSVIDRWVRGCNISTCCEVKGEAMVSLVLSFQNGRIISPDDDQTHTPSSRDRAGAWLPGSVGGKVDEKGNRGWGNKKRRCTCGASDQWEYPDGND